MSREDDENRCRLESAIKELERDLDDAIKYGTGDLIQLRTQLNAAREALYEWRNQITQVFAAPAGMVAVFERRDTLEEYIPVSFLALHRSGKVFPYIFVGNCESQIPSDYPNFLRIDFARASEEALPLECLATEVADIKPPPRLELQVDWSAA
jgi:hypothetical protein